MFVQSEKFVKEHQGNIKNLSIYGQESNPTTLRLSKMNLAIRGIDAKIELGDTLLDDKHKDLKADFIIANPPFNISDWNGEQLRDDIRWKYGVPSLGNANYAWLQHFVHKLSPNGVAGIVLANGSMNSNSGNEGEIRKNMIEAGLIDCMVSLPSQLFYNTMIPACLWFLAKHKKQKDEILFIDARKLGTMVNRRNKELNDDDLKQISDTYHNWRNSRNLDLQDERINRINKKNEITENEHDEKSSKSLNLDLQDERIDRIKVNVKNIAEKSSKSLNLDNQDSDYADIAGFCKVATLEEVRENAYVLMPGRYVGTEEEIEDTVPFADKMQTLTTLLAKQFAEGDILEKTIRENLKTIGYEL